MPRRLAISSAERPEASRNALRRLPMSSKRSGMFRRSHRRHDRACRGHPRLSFLSKTWMAGTSPAMTETLGRRLSLQALRRIERGSNDALIAGAAAEIAGDRDAHLLLGRVRII